MIILSEKRIKEGGWYENPSIQKAWENYLRTLQAVRSMRRMKYQGVELDDSEGFLRQINPELRKKWDNYQTVRKLCK